MFQIKKMAEHSSHVNSCCIARRGPPLIVSGSDDGTAKLWDMRHRGCIQTFPDKYQVDFTLSMGQAIMLLKNECPVTSFACIICCYYRVHSSMV